MPYKINEVITSSTRVKACDADPKRTKVVITNESGETVRWGDAAVTYAAGRGAPIFNNGRLEIDRANGRDPTAARFVIGSAGGTLTVEEEWAN